MELVLSVQKTKQIKKIRAFISSRENNVLVQEKEKKPVRGSALRRVYSIDLAETALLS